MMNVYSLRRCFLFVVSLFINALGIDFITKALLGTSPITGVNYVLSLFTPLTMGQWTIIVNILFMLFELPFMTHESFKEDLRPYLLQIPISLSFGIFIDWGMNMLFWVAPVNFVQQIVYLLIGCCVLAMGIALEMKVNVAMTAGEFFVKVIAQRLKHPFWFCETGIRRDAGVDSLHHVVSLLVDGYRRRAGYGGFGLACGPYCTYGEPLLPCARPVVAFARSINEFRNQKMESCRSSN